MKETKVGEIRKLITVKPAIVLEDEQVENVIKIFIDNPVIRAVYVIDEKERLVGIITMQDILKKISIDFSSMASIYSESNSFGYKIASSRNKNTARDLMDPEIYYVLDIDPIEKAFNLLFSNKAGEIPVVDKNERLIGDLNIIELLILWHQNYIREGAV
ncbi:MAG: hypothetical protein DRP70_09770 [Spirochaetes bacterium]|nr:MAG: hypothetical protein DRP70_09770 [Spirochaetota bacterium]RKX97823.1 MAG: hypothetical protein DRZ90_05030 [Spirochaetota bacterium]